MGKMLIKNLRFKSRHGYHDFERVVGNLFEIDLEFEIELAMAGESDNLDHTLDYSKACAVVEDVMNSEPVLLIETLLAQIGDQLMEHYPEVQKLDVKLRKLSPPMEIVCDYVEISDQWQR
jgi:dihydroneopterin aldolase